MAQLRFSFPFKAAKTPRSCRESAVRTAAEVVREYCEVLEDVREKLRELVGGDWNKETDRKTETQFQGLFGGVHHSLAILENSVDAVCFKSKRRATESEMKTALSKAFSQATNTIWAQISFSVRSGPVLRLTEALKSIEDITVKARETQAQFQAQLKECEERPISTYTSPKNQFDSVETLRMDWEEPSWRQTQKVLQYLAMCKPLDLSSPQLSSGLHVLIEECFESRKEGEVVKELEREIEKVRWRADVLARSLREAYRLKGDVTGERSYSSASAYCSTSELGQVKLLNDTLAEENLGLKKEISALTKRSQSTLEELKRKLSGSEAGLKALQEQVQQSSENTAAFETQVFALIHAYEARIAQLASKVACFTPVFRLFRHKEATQAASEEMGRTLKENTAKLEEQRSEIHFMGTQLLEVYKVVATLAPRLSLSLEPAESINIEGESSSELKKLRQEIASLNEQLDDARGQLVQMTTEADLRHESEVSLLNITSEVRDQLLTAQAETAAINTELTGARTQVATLQAAVLQLEQRETELIQACQLATLQRASSDEVASNVQQQLEHLQEVLERWSAAFEPTSISPEDAAATVARLQEECRELREEQSEMSLRLREQEPLTYEDQATHTRKLETQLQEMEEEHVLLSKENFAFLKQMEEFRAEKAKNAVLLADLQTTLQELEKGWAQAKRREKEMEAELQSLSESLERAHREDPKQVDSEQIKRILDEIEEKDKELLHLRTLAGTYREQVAVLRSKLQEKEDENQSLEEQQQLVLQELEVLHQPLDQVVIEAVQKSAELVLLQEKFTEETKCMQQLQAENQALEAKTKLLMSTLAELKSSERVLLEFGTPKETLQSFDFGEDPITSAVDAVNKSLSQDLHALLGLDEGAEICRKVNYASKEWVLVRLPKGGFTWVMLGASDLENSEILASKFREVQRLVHAYEPDADITLAVSHMLCLLERAKLLHKSNIARSSESTTFTTQVDSEHLQELVLRLLKLLPSL